MDPAPPPTIDRFKCGLRAPPPPPELMETFALFLEAGGACRPRMTLLQPWLCQSSPQRGGHPQGRVGDPQERGGGDWSPTVRITDTEVQRGGTVSPLDPISGSAYDRTGCCPSRRRQACFWVEWKPPPGRPPGRLGQSGSSSGTGFPSGKDERHPAKKQHRRNHTPPHNSR